MYEMGVIGDNRQDYFLVLLFNRGKRLWSLGVGPDAMDSPTTNDQDGVRPSYGLRGTRRVSHQRFQSYLS
jgi:hypothetical protein